MGSTFYQAMGAEWIYSYSQQFWHICLLIEYIYWINLFDLNLDNNYYKWFIIWRKN